MPSWCDRGSRANRRVCVLCDDVQTVAEAHVATGDMPGHHAKKCAYATAVNASHPYVCSLFLCDKKKKNFWLLTAATDTTVSLKVCAWRHTLLL